MTRDSAGGFRFYLSTLLCGQIGVLRLKVLIFHATLHAAYAAHKTQQFVSGHYISIFYL